MKKVKSLYVIIAVNTIITYACIAIGFSNPNAVLSIPELKHVYDQAIEIAKSIPAGPSGFPRYAMIQLQSVGSSVILAIATVFSSSIDLAIDSLLRGAYIALNVVPTGGGLVLVGLELLVDVFSNVLTLSAASALGIEIWRALLLRRKVSRWRIVLLVEILVIGLAIQCIYIPVLNIITP